MIWAKTLIVNFKGTLVDFLKLNFARPYSDVSYKRSSSVTYNKPDVKTDSKPDILYCGLGKDARGSGKGMNTYKTEQEKYLVKAIQDTPFKGPSHSKIQIII